MQQCNLIIDKQKIKYLDQKKPSPPTLKAQLELHKHGIPIRPVINNMKAPSYKLSKHLVKILKNYITINNCYNITNSVNLANDLTKLKINRNHKLITYDIKDVYVSIPIEETLTITKSKLLEINDIQTTKQIITLKKLILSQNYFTFQNKIYQPEKGGSIRSPISSIITEIFLQHFEDMHIKQLLDTKSTKIHSLHRRHLNHKRHTKNSPKLYQFTYKTNVNQSFHFSSFWRYFYLK
jgi:hypothetical protein